MGKKAIIYLAVALVILAFFVGFRIYAAQKRKKEKTHTDPSKMPPRKLTRSFTVKAKLEGAEWDNLAKWFTDNQGRVIDGDGGSKIVYWGESASAQFGGMLNVPFEQMPVRIIFLPNGESLDVRMDEDFGFQMFAGPAKSAFVEKNEKAFDFFEENIKRGFGAE